MNRSRTSWPPVVFTGLILLLLFAVCGAAFPRFASLRVLLNCGTDNAVLGAAAIGMTFVILSGGIDLSVGALAALTSVLVALLVERLHWNPWLALPAVLAAGTFFGTLMGLLIRFLGLPSFLVTLAGLFLFRGAALLLSRESLAITHPDVLDLASASFGHLGTVRIPLIAALFLILFLLAWGISRFSRFGRYVYALGGNPQAAELMGLPVSPVQVGVYALSGFCSALAGILYVLYTCSGNANAVGGLELDAIAATVIGGTLLSGGIGGIPGTLLGVLIFGVIQTAITFQGTLSSWWTKIAVGTLLLGFILLQHALQRRTRQTA